MTTEKKNVYQRIAAAMEDVDYIQKEKSHGLSYSVVSHDAVTARVRPALLKHGIIYFPTRCDHVNNGNRVECSMTIRFVNVDDPIDYFEVPTFGYGIDNQDKGPGKAMSYAVKYALLKALGLETGDDPDTDTNDTTHEVAPRQSQQSQTLEKLKQFRPSCAEMKRKLGDLDNDLLDCHSETDIDGCASEWRKVVKDENWPQDYMEAVKRKLDDRRQEVGNRDDDRFPGDE